MRNRDRELFVCLTAATMIAMSFSACRAAPERAGTSGHSQLQEGATEPSALPMPDFVYVHQAADSSDVLLLMHGYGADEQDLLPLAQDVGWTGHVVSLQAPTAMGAGRYSWYPLEFTDSGIVRDEGAVPGVGAEVVAFIAHLSEVIDGPVDDVVLMGFSQGAIMSMEVACQAPDAVTAIVALSGRTPPTLEHGCEPLQSVRAFVSHGQSDEVIGIDEGREAVVLLERLGAPTTFVEYPMAHSISRQTRADVRDWLAPFAGTP